MEQFKNDLENVLLFVPTPIQPVFPPKSPPKVIRITQSPPVVPEIEPENEKEPETDEDLGFTVPFSQIVQVKKRRKIGLGALF